MLTEVPFEIALEAPLGRGIDGGQFGSAKSLDSPPRC